MSDLNVSLVLSAVDRMSPALANAARQAQAFAAKASGASGLGLLGAAAGNVGTHMRNVGAAAAQVGQRIAYLGTAGGLLGGGLFALLKTQVIDVAAQFERFEAQLTALEGSADGARRALAWASDFERRTPLELAQVVDAYAKLRTFGLDPTNGTLQALVDTMAKSGKGAEHLDGIILAVGQAWTKQKLQGEEALQLIERGVPVWDLLSKATGKSAVQLQEMASKGKLGRDAIKLLVQMMGKEAAGASERMANTWDGLLSSLASAWQQFGLAIGRAGVFDFLKGKLKELLDTIDRMAASGQLQELAQVISGKLVEGLREAWSAFQSFIGIAQAGMNGLLAVKDFFGSWTPILAAVGAVIAGPLIASVVSLTASIATLGAVIGVTPIGLMIGLLAGLTAAGIALWRNWDAVTKGVVGAWEWAHGALAAVWEAILSAVQPLIGAVSGALGAAGRLVGLSPEAPAAMASAAPAAAAAQRLTGEVNVKLGGAPKGTRVTGLQASRGLDLGLELGPMMVLP